MQARELIATLRLAPHPEGGWYREIHRSASSVDAVGGRRAALTSIYYLLERAQLSRWHVVDADEVWHHCAGAPLELLAYDPSARRLARQRLCAPDAGGEPAGGEPAGGEPVGVIAAGIWQAARSLGEYSLVGCTVAPGFEFTGFRFVSELPGHARHFVADMEPLRQLL